MLPIIKTKIVPSIGVMHNIALRHIFDTGSVSYEERAVLEEGLEAWAKKTDLSTMDRWEVKRIINALIANEKGYFNRSKELQVMRGIDYRIMYKAGLPYVDVENRTWFNKG
jgi:hypothetical protein